MRNISAMNSGTMRAYPERIDDSEIGPGSGASRAPGVVAVRVPLMMRYLVCTSLRTAQHTPASTVGKDGGGMRFAQLSVATGITADIGDIPIHA